MKRLLSILLLSLCILCMGTFSVAATISLGFAWDSNIESDMKEYEVYRTDVIPRVSVCKVQHPVVTCLNNLITVPDGSQGTMTFVVVARDLSLNTSGDSNIVSYVFDQQAPLPPKTFRKL